MSLAKDHPPVVLAVPGSVRTCFRNYSDCTECFSHFSGIHADKYVQSWLSELSAPPPWALASETIGSFEDALQATTRGLRCFSLYDSLPLQDPPPPAPEAAKAVAPRRPAAVEAAMRASPEAEIASDGEPPNQPLQDVSVPSKRKELVQALLGSMAAILPDTHYCRTVAVTAQKLCQGRGYPLVVIFEPAGEEPKTTPYMCPEDVQQRHHLVPIDLDSCGNVRARSADAADSSPRAASPPRYLRMPEGLTKTQRQAAVVAALPHCVPALLDPQGFSAAVADRPLRLMSFKRWSSSGLAVVVTGRCRAKQLIASCSNPLQSARSIDTLCDLGRGISTDDKASELHVAGPGSVVSLSCSPAYAKRASAVNHNPVTNTTYGEVFCELSSAPSSILPEASSSSCPADGDDDGCEETESEERRAVANSPRSKFADFFIVMDCTHIARNRLLELQHGASAATVEGFGGVTAGTFAFSEVRVPTTSRKGGVRRFGFFTAGVRCKATLLGAPERFDADELLGLNGTKEVGREAIDQRPYVVLATSAEQQRNTVHPAQFLAPVLFTRSLHELSSRHMSSAVGPAIVTMLRQEVITQARSLMSASASTSASWSSLVDQLTAAAMTSGSSEDVARASAGAAVKEHAASIARALTKIQEAEAIAKKENYGGPEATAAPALRGFVEAQEWMAGVVPPEIDALGFTAGRFPDVQEPVPPAAAAEASVSEVDNVPSAAKASESAPPRRKVAPALGKTPQQLLGSRLSYAMGSELFADVSPLMALWDNTVVRGRFADPTLLTSIIEAALESTPTVASTQCAGARAAVAAQLVTRTRTWWATGKVTPFPETMAPVSALQILKGLDVPVTAPPMPEWLKAAAASWNRIEDGVIFKAVYHYIGADYAPPSKNPLHPPVSGVSAGGVGTSHGVVQLLTGNTLVVPQSRAECLEQLECALKFTKGQAAFNLIEFLSSQLSSSPRAALAMADVLSHPAVIASIANERFAQHKVDALIKTGPMFILQRLAEWGPFITGTSWTKRNTKLLSPLKFTQLSTERQVLLMTAALPFAIASPDRFGQLPKSDPPRDAHPSSGLSLCGCFDERYCHTTGGDDDEGRDCSSRDIATFVHSAVAGDVRANRSAVARATTPALRCETALAVATLRFLGLVWAKSRTGLERLPPTTMARVVEFILDKR